MSSISTSVTPTKPKPSPSSSSAAKMEGNSNSAVNGASSAETNKSPSLSLSRKSSRKGSTTSFGELTDDDLIGIQVLRERLSIPPELNTNLNVSRWLRAYEHDLDACEKELRNYLASRKAAGLEAANLIDSVMMHPLSQRYLPYFSVSCLSDRSINEKANAIVFYQRMKHVDFHEVLKVIKLGDLVHMYFMYNEYYLQLMLRREAATGKRSSCQVVFDLEGLHIADYLNPIGAIAKTGRLLSHMWQTWFGDQISQIYVLHPPRVVSAVWQLAHLFLNKRLRNRICLVHSNTALIEKVGVGAVPVSLGGSLKDTSGWCDVAESCLNTPKQISSVDYYSPGQLFVCLESEPKATKQTVKRGQSVVVSRTVADDDSVFLYQFRCSSELSFSVYFHDPATKSKVLVHPCYLLDSVKLPEEGIIDCKQKGEYDIEFCNSTNWLGVTLEYIVQAVPKTAVPPEIMQYQCFR